MGQLLVRAGVESAVQSLAGDTNNWDAATESWGQEIRFQDVPLEGGTYSITHEAVDAQGRRAVRYGLADEERRINLNLADTNLIEAIFRIAGEVDRRTASDTVVAIGRYWTVKNERAAGRDRLLTGRVESGYSERQEGAVIRFESLPELLLVGGQLQFSPVNAKLCAGLAAIAVAWRTRNTLLTLLAGMAVLHLVRTLNS